MNLAEFISQYRGIKQRTQEWLDVRKYGIGGSQIATLMGKNPYSDISALLADKTGLSTFGFKLVTYWGNIFEPIIREYAELQHNTQIVGDQIFIRSDESPLYYSPDGFGELKCEISPEVAQYLTTEELQQTTRNVLFEFKCPFMRIPRRDGPPEYYIPQAQLGLKLAPICDECKFIEAVFRKCSVADFGFNSSFDKSLRQQCRWRSPLAIGYIVFYGDIDIKGFIDIGDSDSIIEHVFEAHHDGRLQATYSRISVGQMALPAQDDFTYPSVFLLPWKLFHVQEHSIDPQPAYFDGIEPILDRFIESIRTITGAPADRKKEALGAEVNKWYHSQ